MITIESRIRLRPSVALVPQGNDEYQFFQGNTRRTHVYRIQPDLFAGLRSCDGSRTIAEVAHVVGTTATRLLPLAARLTDACLLEHADVASRVMRSPWRRVLNFLADYFPSPELEDAFGCMRRTQVVILGVGAVGSWIAVQLVQSGFTRLTLIDDDKVARSNLNRSLFAEPDVGRPKVVALAERLRQIEPFVEVQEVDSRIGDAQQLQQLLGICSGQCIVVNCADEPNVDTTSALVDEACQALRIPYVIAGGYNLHLSLIGISVIPGETACYQCGRLTLNELQGTELDDLRKLVRPWRNIGNLGPLAAITASFAVNEVIRLALPQQRIQPKMINRRGEYNFLTNELHFSSLPRRPECACSRASPPPGR